MVILDINKKGQVVIERIYSQINGLTWIEFYKNLKFSSKQYEAISRRQRLTAR